MSRIMFLKIVCKEWEQKQSTWHLLYKQWLYKCYEVHEDQIEFQTEQVENTTSAERQKNSFPKEKVENEDLHKFILNKIMTKYE